MAHTYDLAAVGNAIVDVLAHCDDEFLVTHDITKGGMILIGAEHALTVYKEMGETQEVAGGSAANSAACLASLGGTAAFIGKVGRDRLGDAFKASMEDVGVKFVAAPMADETATGRCLINVTPDAERSMLTFIGAAEHVSEADVDEDVIGAAAVTYFEGYLFEQPVARKAMEKAATIARRAGRKTGITLSDKGCVERQHGNFVQFIKDHVDIVFANEEEAKALAGTDSLEDAVEKLTGISPYLAITRSEKGSIVMGPDSPAEAVDAVAPDQLVDTTGAGDAYAGGFIFGLTRGMPLATCAKLGSLAASEVISHMGPRPQKSLEQMAKDHGLI
ncbi:adenosine kinase [Aquisalinus flavus]|uniref:Adenosine kinase n=1 Tax=Aquisalinus flavus TaxID=1526572 RepID=A0A8J2Y867_9PROT|nr:adenosine kinase [Aquisalinus flavus]MBD0425620.1 adenosine kinase [Aquisalinus flavus]UNE48762.1 adenosine kinase [Aquisalinus flavus]GGD14569.1 adenosine kinase [Aquisalinus flavus]